MSLSERFPVRAVLLTLVAVTALHGLRILGVHGWSDDGSAYLRHAMNLLEGRPYNEVPYTPLGDQPPVTLYPPALPLILAPFLQVWGLDFRVFQILMLGIFLLSLGASLAALSRTFPPWVALGAVALLGADTAVGLQTEHINSDFLGLLWVALLVWWSEGFDWSTASLQASLGRSAIAVLLLFAAAETRTINAVLVSVFPIFSWWRYRRFTYFSLLTPAWTAVLVTLLRQGESSAYMAHLRLITPVTVRRNMIQYALSLADFLGLNAYGWQRFLALAAMAIAVWGAAQVLRSQRPFWFLAAALYGSILILWPYSDPERFLVPCLPVLLACFLYGITDLADRLPNPLSGALRIGVPALALCTSAYSYWSTPAMEVGLNSPPTLELYRAVEQLTPPDSLIALRKPRSLSLFTGRRSATYSFVDPPRMRREFCEGGVTHVVSAPRIFPDDVQFLEPAFAAGGFTPLFHNDSFTLYAVTLCGAQ